jgi:hypothetical protein
MQLWDALNLKEGQQVMSAMLIAKVVDLREGKEDNPPSISIAASEGADWIDQAGLLKTATDLTSAGQFFQEDEDS